MRLVTLAYWGLFQITNRLGCVVLGAAARSCRCVRTRYQVRTYHIAFFFTLDNTSVLPARSDFRTTPVRELVVNGGV